MRVFVAGGTGVEAELGLAREHAASSWSRTGSTAGRALPCWTGDHRVLSALVLETLDGRVQTTRSAVRSVVNPDKLGHHDPVADARALRREAPDVGWDVGSDAQC